MKKTKRTLIFLVLSLCAQVVIPGIFTGDQSVQAQQAQELKAKGEDHSNMLAFENSPYLLQHADDPVNWYPWGPEAFERAKEENKPIFLSIGYSSCHWCHVMERESYEDAEVARLMNETFVAIKVDREERPDINRTYMLVAQLLTGGGGWPLNVIMTPDKKPFFATTYIPKESRFGRKGMVELIPLVQQLWTEQRGEVLKSAESITETLRQLPQEARGEDIDESTLHNGYAHLLEKFDTVFGGFGRSPKFPSAHTLAFLLRYWNRTGEDRSLEMVEKTLQEMRRGGLYDHVGTGFHRYSTDERWLVPHFEKMLYDQALLSMVYIEAYQVTGKEEYAQTARDLLDFVLREMTSTEGGFYTAVDADSEEEEGRFYMWTFEEVRNLFSAKELDILITVFNIKMKGNFIDPMQGTPNGQNILHRTKSITELASEMNMNERKLEKTLKTMLNTLYLERKKRTKPFVDDKILTDWNGLMIAAFARAARVFDEEKYTLAAKTAMDFIGKTMLTSGKRMFHRYWQGQSAITAQVDDYAFLIWGVLELYETTFEISYLETAIGLNLYLLQHFWDEVRGGFFTSPDDGETILVRLKEIYDGALPSGNAVAMYNLMRLARITADAELEEKAAEIGRVFSKLINESPSLHTQLLLALDFALGPSHEVIVVGREGAKDTREMFRTLRRFYAPNKVVVYKKTYKDNTDLEQIAPYTKNYTGIKGKATAYVCINYECELPTTNSKQVLELLNVR